MEKVPEIQVNSGSNNSRSASYIEQENAVKAKAADEKNKLSERKLNELKTNYIRVGDHYYKLVGYPDVSGRKHPTYIRRNKETINDDFGAGCNKLVPSYEDWVCIPDHINYSRNYHGFFNRYEIVTHVPKEGDISTIITLLKHVFGTHFEFALDYLQLLYIRPTQRLPIILLESKERGTGKSTFGTLVAGIFQGNAIKMGSSDLTNRFNEYWVSKLTIVVDEASLNKDGVGEMLKRLSTEKGKIVSEAKGKDQKEVDFFGKFIFMSNQEGEAVEIERGETRYAVFKVPTFAESGITSDPNADTKMLDEIPAFLYFLKNRTLHYKEAGRMYFDPSVYRTNQLLTYFEGSDSHTAKTIKIFLRDAFSMFPDHEVLKYGLTDILEELNVGGYTRRVERGDIKQALEKELSLSPEKKGRYIRCQLHQAENMESSIAENYKISEENKVYYVFPRNVFGESET